MRRLLVVLAYLVVSNSAAAQPTGAPPTPSLGFVDPAEAFALPPLKDSPNGQLGRETAGLQVVARARHLGLNGGSAAVAWRQAGPLLAASRSVVLAAQARPQTAETVFSGDRTSDLNALLLKVGSGNIRVTAPNLVVDQPLRLTGANVRLDLDHATLTSADPKLAYLVRIEGARGVALVGGVFTGRGAAVLVSASDDVTITQGIFIALSGSGVVVTDARRVSIWGNRLSELHQAPILLHGATEHAVIADNEIEGNLGASNWAAGVVVTDRTADLRSTPTSLFLADGYWVPPQPIVQRLTIPRHNLIAFNQISNNRASGVYFDGAAENVVVSNIIEANAKEGMCLDNGSTANVVALNTIQQNGKRWGSSDEDLKRDFIAGFGRLPDGSAVAKVPGLSIDNAAYNLVYGNDVLGNYGGGIKMVRTGYFNTIGLNTLMNNNEGRSANFHFFGIELGAAAADAPAPDLDFTPSRGNIIFSNMIRGSHYSGIFFAPGSELNDFFDNSIFGATSWAIESAHRENNSILNNLTNLPSRNASPGLDPKLPALTAGRFD